MFGTYSDSGLTPAMRRVEAQLEHGHLVPETEKFALKSAGSLQGKAREADRTNPGPNHRTEPRGVHDRFATRISFEDGYT